MDGSGAADGGVKRSPPPVAPGVERLFSSARALAAEDGFGACAFLRVSRDELAVLETLADSRRTSVGVVMSELLKVAQVLLR